VANNAYTDANGVFKNLLGTTDGATLQRAEYALAAIRSREILEGHARLAVTGYGLARQVAIHGHLFQDVYEWAGKIRTVPSSKRAESGTITRFAEPGAIAGAWQALEHRTTEFVAAQGLGFEQKRDALVFIFIEANRIHAFSEGNGRSLQIFMKELAVEQGVRLDYAKVSPSAWNRASAVSGTHGRMFEGMHFIAARPDPEPMRKIFADMATPLSVAE